MSASLRRGLSLNDNSTNQPSSLDFLSLDTDVEGDIALVCVTQSSGANTCATPTGWTLLSGPVTTASNFKSYVFGKKLEAADVDGDGATHTFQWTGGARSTGTALVIQGADTIAEIVVGTPTSGAVASLAGPSVTTVESDCFLAHFYIGRLNATTQASCNPPAGVTGIAECNTNITASAPNFANECGHNTSNTGAAGSYGGGTFTSPSASHMHVHSMAVTSAPTNVAPTADAGADQTNKATGVTVTLDGTGSTDSDGTITSYQWTQTGGTTVTLVNDDTDTATFDVPSVASDETLTFQLEVTDNLGATDTDTCTVGILLDPPDVDDGGLRIYRVDSGALVECAMYVVVGGALVELADTGS